MCRGGMFYTWPGHSDGAAVIAMHCKPLGFDLFSWQKKIEGDIAGIDNDHQVEVCMEELPYDRKHIPYRDGILTIGCCGYTNVGKSSLMNGLMGRKVVSVSRTPGHTKHFQTIYLTPTVKLCDSPGLVFPSLVSKSMQILAGIYPIAQVREPYSAVQYLAERIPLPELLHVRHPEDEKGDSAKEYRWSAFDICDAWAKKRGFVTAKAARHDVYRAANNILRLAVDGRICLCTRPPEFTKQKSEWETHKDTLEVNTLKSLNLGSSGDNNFQGDLCLDSDDRDSSDDKDTDDDEGIVRCVALQYPTLKDYPCYKQPPCCPSQFHMGTPMTQLLPRGAAGLKIMGSKPSIGCACGKFHRSVKGCISFP
ncbi:hypothetical protein LSH36_49g06051 [Paralvinella palmiformis]|uniref:Guanine nucleotide-binding protein-like 1 n=1 Tax=Paralvinella palmiformis TaxID=53620 RepID=A0AAD9NEN2_9ANNE|nr:hypothetical protein LSH36_49g06051 [Paralvinella palmiformis]